jgi:hypothetical protein
MSNRKKNYAVFVVLSHYIGVHGRSASLKCLCGLFNDAGSISDYIISCDWMIQLDGLENFFVVDGSGSRHI